ncbi:MAG: PAS domain S-box protein [Flavobacteriales bacterium]|nr:PAS domain S-box protein [Flavobacteriales bacterium]
MPFNTLLNHPVDKVLIVDPKDLRIVEVNDRAAQSWKGMKWNEALSKKIDESLKQTIEKAILSAGYFAFENLIDDFQCVIQPLPENGHVHWLVRLTPHNFGSNPFESLFHTSGEAIVIVDNEQIVDCNERTEVIFGYAKEEILAQKPFDFDSGIFSSTDCDTDLYLHKFQRALEGEDQRATMTCRRKDGSTFHADIKMTAFEAGKKTLVQQVIRDVSERVLYEAAMRESEERFRLLSNVAMESVVFINEETIIDCNDQFASLLVSDGRNSLIGKKITEFIKRDEFDRILAILELNSLNKSEIRCSTKQGDMLILETSGSYINYQGERVIAMLFYDITSRKRAEQALEQSSERFKNLVENSPNAVFILTDGKIKYANQSGVSLLAFGDEDELYDLKFLQFFDPKARREVDNDLEMIRHGRDVDYKEMKIMDSDGKPVDIGIKSTLTIYDRKPSIQITVNNLSTRMMLLQEQVRAQLAEEINAILKKEIEEHKRTQRKLIETQNFTRNIIESSIDMIIAVDHDSKITEFNKAAQQLFGYSLKEVIGKEAEMLYARKSEYKDVRRGLAKDGTFTGEIENLSKNGDVFTALLSASLIRTPEGDVMGSMGVSRDITEIKEAEEELRASEERYRDIFEHASDFILSVDGKGNFIYANESFQKTLGYSEKQLKKLNIKDMIDNDCFVKGSLFDSLVSEELVIHFRSKKGKKIISEGESSIRYQGKKRDSIRVILRDVTEAKEKEREVLEQKAKLESIFESTRNMMIWTLDDENTVSSCNSNFTKGFKTITGLKIKEGDNFLEKIKSHVAENRYQGQLMHFQEAFAGQASQFELPLSRDDGKATWLQVFLNPIYVNEQLSEISCLSYDVTDRIEIDRKIRDSLREKEVLLQEVHHRVKNNLQVISSILNLQSSFVTDEGTLEILKESQDRIKSMSFIHEALYRNIDISQIDFTDYIETLARSLIQSYSLTSAHVQLNVDMDEVFLSLDQAIPCGLIINEIITNALKYAYVDVDKPILRVLVKEVEDQMTIQVSDNGIGLPEDFKYEDSDSLGIQLVYTLVEQLDGEIDVNSKDGTSFKFTFTKT